MATQSDETTPIRELSNFDAQLPLVQQTLLRLIGQTVAAMHSSVYLVGGFVRDLLHTGTTIGVSALDLDLVIEGDAIVVARQMAQNYGGRLIVHQQFGTAKWILSDPAWPVQWEKLFGRPTEVGETASAPSLDFVTARTESYSTPAALPTVTASTIKLDLQRRDFTINTLALCLTPARWGELLNFYGGMADLQQGVVRVLHDGSFVDDPTRLLRAVRYEQRFGFAIEPHTLALLNDARALVDHLSPARLRHELERIFEEAQPEQVLIRLHDLGILTSIHPNLQAADRLINHFAQLRQQMADPQDDPTLRQAPLTQLYWGVIAWSLPAAVQADLGERLQLDHETQRLMRAMQQLAQQAAQLATPQLRPSQAVAILDPIDFTAQSLCRALTLDPKLTQVLEQYANHWRRVRPLLNGRDLQALGLPPGPRYRQILAQLRAARLDGIMTTRAEEAAWVAKDSSPPPAPSPEIQTADFRRGARGEVGGSA